MTAAAEQLLQHAVTVLDRPDDATAGNSARLAAFLARQAVEELIDARCAQLCATPVTGGRRKPNSPYLNPSTPRRRGRCSSAPGTS